MGSVRTMPITRNIEGGAAATTILTFGEFEFHVVGIPEQSGLRPDGGLIELLKTRDVAAKD